VDDVLQKIDEVKAAAGAHIRFASADERQQIMSHFTAALIYLQNCVRSTALAELTSKPRP
jgi:hypothetical protein